jgi:protein tyrosine phosphatase (PTP) superfamily phosphohydrolase (DUF442 family)
MGIEGSYNFRRINDRVTTSGVVGEKILSNLRNEGYDALINLLPGDNDYAVPGEDEIVGEQGLHYVYIPVDFAAPSQADFDAFVKAMDEMGNKTVHVHCAANFRVSAFYSLYAMRNGWWTEAQADEHIRSIWNPEQYPAWEMFIAVQRQKLFT